MQSSSQETNDNTGWGVGPCVPLRARSSCTPPLLAGVCGVGVLFCARVSAAPRHSRLECQDVCASVWALCLYPAIPGWGLSCVGLVLPGACSCAVVRCVLCVLPGFAAPGGRCCVAPVRVPWLWPAACLSGVPPGPAWCAAPRPVPLLSVLRSAFPTPWCLSPPRGLAPPALLGGCAGHAEANRELGSLCLLLAPAEAGALGSLRLVSVRGPAMGLAMAGPSGVGLGLRALRWLACVDPVTDASGFPYRPSSDGGLGRCTGAVSCGRRHRPFPVGGCHARVPRVCACACPAWPGRAGPPPGRVVVRLTFFYGRSCCARCLLGPLRAGVALFSLCAPRLFLAFLVFGPGLPWAFTSCCPPLTPLFPFSFLFFSSPPASLFFFAVCAPVVSGVPCFRARGALGLGVFLYPPPFSFFFPCFFPLFFLPAFPLAFFFSFPPPAFLCFFFPPLCALVVSGVPCAPAWGALGRGVLLSPPATPPPFFFFLPVFFFFLSVPCRYCGAGLVGVSWAVGCAGVCFSCSVAVVGLCAVLSRPSGAGWCCVVLPVVFGCLLLGLAVLCCLLVGLGVVFRWCCPCLAAWLPVLWFGVVCVGVPLPCVCSVALCCCVVVCCGALLFTCVVACACCLFPVAARLLCVLLGVVLCVPCPLRPVPCCSALCWCPCVVLSAWSALFPVPAAVGSRCRCVFLGVCWFLWLPGAVVWWCLSALVSVSGRFSRRSASSLWCPAPLCCVLRRCAAVWCCAVVPCRLFFLPCLWRSLSVSPETFPVKPVKWFSVFERKLKLYSTQPTRVQQDHIVLSDLRVTRRPPWRRC